MSHNLIVVLGPTAVGKTKFAVQLARKFGGEIISADSRQVYKSMDIGTGKDLSEYKYQNSSIPYHLIDIIEPTEEYNLYQFQKDFLSCFEQVSNRQKIPFLVGGTGLYIHSLLMDYNLVEVDFNSERGLFLSNLEVNELQRILSNLQPNLHNTTDLIDKQRIIKAILIAENMKIDSSTRLRLNPLVIGITEDRNIIKSRITLRLKTRLKSGMIEEVEQLVKNGISYEKLDFFGLEYRFIGKYLKGELNYNDMYQKLNSSIHQFSKRQMTWFRKMEREGVKINWFSFDDFENAENLISNFLRK